MPTRTFTKDELEARELPYTAILDEIKDTSRWSEHHQIVFEYDGKHYRTHYSQGLTEDQDEQPWEYDKEIKAVEVEEQEITVKKWIAV